MRRRGAIFECNRIIPSDYRILLLLKMPIPNVYIYFYGFYIHYIAKSIGSPPFNGGNISSSGKQPSGPAPFITALVADPLNKPGGMKAGGSWSGEGSNVCNRGGGARESHCSALPRVAYPAWPWPRPAGTGEPEKIRFVLSLGRTAAYLHSYSLCPFWSPKDLIFTCKAVSFIVMESIFRLIVSVSMLTALPTASIITGSLVRLWTAVPVF